MKNNRPSLDLLKSIDMLSWSVRRSILNGDTCFVARCGALHQNAKELRKRYPKMSIEDMNLIIRLES